jgi:hypothetical protein
MGFASIRAGVGEWERKPRATCPPWGEGLRLGNGRTGLWMDSSERTRGRIIDFRKRCSRYITRSLGSVCFQMRRRISFGRWGNCGKENCDLRRVLAGASLTILNMWTMLILL